MDKLQTGLPIYAERFQVTGINLDEPRSALPRQAQVRCVKNLHHGFQAAAFGQLPQAAQQGHVRGEPHNEQKGRGRSSRRGPHLQGIAKKILAQQGRTRPRVQSRSGRARQIVQIAVKVGLLGKDGEGGGPGRVVGGGHIFHLQIFADDPARG